MNAASAIVEGTLDDSLAKFLKKNIVKKELKDEVGAPPPTRSCMSLPQVPSPSVLLLLLLH